MALIKNLKISDFKTIIDAQETEKVLGKKRYKNFLNFLTEKDMVISCDNCPSGCALGFHTEDIKRFLKTL